MAEKTTFNYLSGVSTESLRTHRCENCDAFQPPSRGQDVGRCCANYPVVIPLPGLGGAVGAASLFPPMRATEWCLKWTPIESNPFEKSSDPEQVPY